jgi:hypothetical protein
MSSYTRIHVAMNTAVLHVHVLSPYPNIVLITCMYVRLRG